MWHRFRSTCIIMHFTNSSYGYFNILNKVPPTNFIFKLFFDCVFGGEIFNLTFLKVNLRLFLFFHFSCFFSTVMEWISYVSFSRQNCYMTLGLSFCYIVKCLILVLNIIFYFEFYKFNFLLLKSALKARFPKTAKSNIKKLVFVKEKCRRPLPIPF